MAHLTEEQLGEYAFDPDALPDRREMEAHLADCPQCSSSLTCIRSIEFGLADPDAWEIAERDDSATREAMRNLAAQAAAEDEQAEHLLEKLLQNPARMAWTRFAKQGKYRTAGVVRRLLRAAHEACDREPLDALTFADTALEIAEQLATYPAPMLHELRANAWKERANALALLGRFDPALDALTHAEREFRNVPASPLGPALVKHARAIVYYERGDLTKAMELLSQSAAAYAALGEIEHYMRARHYVANVLYRQQDIRSAQAIYEVLLAWGEGENDLRWIARENNTLGRCAYELSDLPAAVRHFHLSSETSHNLGLTSEAVRPEWGLALVMLASGKPADAVERFRTLRQEFHRRKMFTDEALISLDLMDALHMLGDDREIIALGADVVRTFTDAGMPTGALTAFAYLNEAATRGVIDRLAINHVRKFVSRAERQPGLLFVAPPENSP